MVRKCSQSLSSLGVLLDTGEGIALLGRDQGFSRVTYESSTQAVGRCYVLQRSEMPQEDKAARTQCLPRETSLNLGHMASSFYLSWSKSSSTHHPLYATGLQGLKVMEDEA